MKKTFNYVNLIFVILTLLFTMFIYFGSQGIKNNKFFSYEYYQEKINQIRKLNSYKKEVDLFDGNINNDYALSIPVLLYHGIDEDSDRFTITPETFRNHIFTLKKNGWNTINLKELKLYLENKIDLPDKSFLLTFDDGRKDSYYESDLILKAVNYEAVMFISAEQSLGENSNRSTYYLNQSELTNMQKTGRWDIQSHFLQKNGGFIVIDSKGNLGNFLSNKKFIFNLGRLESELEYAERISDEITNSKKVIEQKLNNSVFSASFPFGDFGQESINNPNAVNFILDRTLQNYDMAFIQVWPKPKKGYTEGYTFNYREDNSRVLKRIEPSTDWSGDDLITVLEKGSYKKIPYSSDKNNSIGWINTWGDFDLDNYSFGASSSTNGSFSHLDGSYPWRDYIYSIKFDWNSGAFVGLVARFIDSNNFTSCIFSKDTIKIEENYQGKIYLLYKGNHELVVGKKNELAILVDGSEVKCLIGNKEVAKAKINSNKTNGGIGLRTWDQSVNNSRIIVDRISVLPAQNYNNYLANSIVYSEKVSKLNQTEINLVTNIVNQKNTESNMYPVISLFDENGSKLFYQLDNNNIESWKNIFGTLYSKNGHLFVGTNASTTSSLAVLGGSEKWTNYKFSSLSKWGNGSSFTLVARYKDSKNYVGCSFSIYGRTVRLFQVVNGETKTLGQSPQLEVPWFSPWENNNFGIIVNDRNVECLKNDNWILRGEVSDSLITGGIGFKTFERLAGYALVEVKKVFVEPLI